MLLKRVSMCGFKSFCDKVDFDFGAGVTCVVGPNGCGKSNIVDAFKWVLGEQSAKSLRGRQMGDMIFNGSSTRKSSSVAQVDLVFDNSDRSLPLDQEEITLTRKLYRSGESEYLLNGGGSRLKDIRELFMDTGVGVDAYSVIEQGRVDQLLQSSPQDRRIIFEEAAGISKYKARKREAERKLERTNQNLLRVADVIEELEKRLRSVKLQAGKARSYQEYQQRLNELRSQFAMAEFHRHTQDLQRETREVEQWTDRASGLRVTIDKHEAEHSQGTVELDRLAQDIGRAENQLTSARSEIVAHNERIAASGRRIEEQQALRQRSTERQQIDRDRLDEARAELERVQETSLKLAEQTDALQLAVTGLNEQDRVLARELAEAQATLEDEKSGIIELLRRSAQLHNEIVRLNTHRESLVGQKGKLHQRGARISAELEQALESKAEFDQKLRVIEDLIAQETQRLEEKKAEAARVNHVRQRLVDELALAKERRSALLSRQELLQDLQRKMEGVGAGVRKLLDEKKTGSQAPRHKAILGLLADLFETDVEHAGIIEAALDGRDQDLVVSACEEFLAEPEAFDSLPGRVRAVCDNRLPPIVHGPNFAERQGFVANALDLVRYKDEHRQLAWHLFSKVILVEDLEAALRLARQETEGYRFVTRRGEVVDSSGRIRLGPTDAKTGLISRKSELRAIDLQLAELDERITTLADQLNRTQTEAAHLETLQQELRNAIYESNAAKIEAASGRQNVADTVERLTQEQPLISQEVLLLEQEINEVLDKSTAGGHNLEQLEQQNRDREQRVSQHQQRIDQVVERRSAVHEQLTQTKVALGQLTEKRSATAENQNALRRAISDLEAAILQAETDIAQCAKIIDESQAAIAKGRQELRTLEETVEDLEADAVRLRTHRDQLRINLDGLAHAIRAARSELTVAESKLHEHQMAVAQVTVRRDDLVARVLDEMGVNLSEKYLEYQHEEQDWEKVEAEIAELRGKIDRLGNVNLDAINELKELEERYNFLAQQREDLDLSIRQLTQLIETLNQESRERFRTAFEQIREHFRGLFRKLFGGGRADIILEDPENSLDTGIEIVAQPPGKELQTISLMSGGEKSMTAIALLMSIFKIRPAPFTILDEVDAALDEANNDRFNRIVREFVEESQFIIITHSKRTMNIADRLYGITMQEPGVSTRVSVQLGQAEVA